MKKPEDFSTNDIFITRYDENKKPLDMIMRDGTSFKWDIKTSKWVSGLNIIIEGPDYKMISEQLWGLLDDIDTASDMFKPEKNNFYDYSMRKVAERFKHISSDGYKLFPVKETNDKSTESPDKAS